MTSIGLAAGRLAREDGVSLNQWIAAAVVEKVGAVETAATFLKARAAGATGGGLRAFLDKAPDATPAPGDELKP